MDIVMSAAQKSGPEARIPCLEALASRLTGWHEPRERLALALRNNEFILYRQNIIPLAARGGARPFLEILVRLQDEEKHLTPPGAFVPIMEHHGLMPELDRWIVERVIAWSASRQPAARTLCSINVAGSTLADAGFTEFIRERLAEYKLAPQLLCFEVGEGDAMTKEGVRFLAKAKALGCLFAIGAFGRGIISFDSLRDAAANFIKIDGSIVREIVCDPVAAAKVQAITRACEEKGIFTVAEFVESPAILRTLRGMGVTYAQGFGISRPGPLDEVA